MEPITSAPTESSAESTSIEAELSKHQHRHEGELLEHQHRADGKLLSLHDRFYSSQQVEIIEWLHIGPEARILDAGCGGGGMTALLAGAARQSGRVVALDLDPDLLEVTRSRVETLGLVGRVSYHEGNVTGLPFEDAEFDLVWSGRVIHGIPDPLAGLREIWRVLKPGGRLALGEGGFPLRFLPDALGMGEPGLEARLGLIRLQWFNQWRETLPDGVEYPFGWSRLLEEAGFSGIKARTFFLEQLAPFTPDQQDFLLSYLRDYLDIPRYRKLLSPADTEVLERLTNPNDPAWVFNRRDLHVLSGSSVYLGYKPA